MSRHRAPRASNYFGMRTTPSIYPDGTWMEPEELAYPHGGFTRRAYVTYPDGINRIVRVSIPDTYFTIPARGRIAGKYSLGFVTAKGQTAEGLKFIPYDRAPKEAQQS